MSRGSHFQSPIYYVLTNEPFFFFNIFIDNHIKKLHLQYYRWYILVCGAVEELAEDLLTISAMKRERLQLFGEGHVPQPVLPTPLICCLKIVIRWFCALQTIRRLAQFLFGTNLKDALRSWNLPQAIYLLKKIESLFLQQLPDVRL